MSLFETSSQFYGDSDSSSESFNSSASSLSSLSSIENSTSLDSSSSSEQSENMPLSTRTRRLRMGIRHSRSSRSSENQNSSDSSVNNTDSEDSSMASNSQHEMSASDHSNNSSRTSQSSDTEPYDVDQEMARINDGAVIEINDTQQMPNDQINGLDADDDDVILIPQHIETIDLCTQAVNVPVQLRNEVIDITDSPRMENSNAGPMRRIRARRNAMHLEDPAPHRPVTSTPNANVRQQLNMDDSANDSQPRVAITCPICLDSVVNRVPVSTLCGHIYCQACIIQALGNAKKCPMCKKALGGRKPFFNIFLP